MTHDDAAAVVEEFRAHDGRVGGRYTDTRLLLLTTVDAAGRSRTTPVPYFPDASDRRLAITRGRESWLDDLATRSRITVEDGVITYEAEASVLTGAERDTVLARLAETGVVTAGAEVVALRQVAGGPPAGVSMGTVLKLVHDAFRREFALVRAEVARSGPRVGAQLRVNCLAVCQGLEFHHHAEDTRMFRALAEQRPDLAPVLERLGAEHVRVAELLEDLRRVVSASDADRDAVVAEVDRLVAELEAHLDYEERELVPILDAASG